MNRLVLDTRFSPRNYANQRKLAHLIAKSESAQKRRISLLMEWFYGVTGLLK